MLVSGFDLAQLAENASQRGRQLLSDLQNFLERDYERRGLPDFGIEKAAELIGCTSQHLRDKESDGNLAQPRTARVGSLDRRVYNYNEINEIRRRLKRDASRPTSCVRLIFSNLKGGVGKTSHALHLSHYAARDGLRVLVVDLDPQATLTTAFGLVPGLNVGAEDDVGPSLTVDPELIQKSIKPTRWNEIDLVPAQLSLQYTDWQMLQARDADSQRLGPLPQRLSRALEGVADRYDLIVMDTPPALGMLSLNAIAAADMILMPITPNFYDIASSVQYFAIVSQLAGTYAQVLRVRQLSLLMTRTDSAPETRGNIALLNKAYGEFLLTNRMPQTRELQRATGDQMSLYEIEIPRGARETYHKAIEAMNAVNAEIMQHVWQVWRAAELHSRGRA
ncbi:MAG: AAA family ATPase [Candidatus Competibacteraceae bacterium]|nr:AAA family ATPase [Candidatus Competibacteraceae bacterium]MBK8896415.1 AAA family ATPase [Candidatus Competibacteraceae bacterium]MBK8964170.1 AAA family ATPase [Candidatus Competibacteraceae bacterium]MBK9952717.1 AAA family ATPase [Candidatus Competibacteraceae bacterium]